VSAPEQIVVTQADREAFQAMIGLYGPAVDVLVASGHFDEGSQMQALASHRIAATRASEERIAGLVKALEDAAALFENLAQPAVGDLRTAGLVRQLGDVIGYGNLMHTASAIWREKLSVDGIRGGEFSCNICQKTAENTLVKIRAALAATKATEEPTP